jgi:hypothetical protein
MNKECGSAVRVGVLLCLILTVVQPVFAGCESPVYQEQLPAIDAGHDVTDLAFGDLGNDGDLDLVTVSMGQATFGVNVHVNDGGDYLAPFALDAAHPSNVTLADMNGDQLLDILVVEQSADLDQCRLFGSCTSLRVFYAAANGGFTREPSATPIPYLETVRRVLVADFDKNGNIDAIAGGTPINASDPSIVHFRGAGFGNSYLTTNGPVRDLAAGDFTNDGNLDFVAAIGKSATTSASHVDLYRNDSGAFSTVTVARNVPSTSQNLRLVTGRFNTTDTHLDVAVSLETTTMIPDFESGGLVLFLGTGSGSLNSGSSFALTTVRPTDITAADVDEDNIPDFIAPSGGSLLVSYGTGNGNFRDSHPQLPATGNALRTFAADFDLDGRDNLAYLDQSGDDVHFLLNTCQSRYIKLTLTSSPNPSTYNGNVVFTATFTVKPNAPVPPTFVTLYEGTTVLGSGTINSAGVANITVSNLTIGNHTVKAYYSGDPDSGYSNVYSNDLVQVVNRPPFGAPLGLVATGNSAANAIQLRWITTADAGTNQILRRDAAGAWQQIGTTASDTFTDSTVDPTKAYVYAVRSVHATDGTTSPNSNIDLATTINPVRPSDKKIRAADTTDVRSLANSLRAAAGLTAFTFTDATLTGKAVKAVHLAELRTAIAQARTALGLPALTFTQPTITVKVTKVKFNDLQELRTSFY